MLLFFACGARDEHTRTLVEAADGTRVFGAGMPVRKDGKVVGRGDLVIR